MFEARDEDVFGFLKTALDAHTMGLNAASQLMLDCGYKIAIAPELVCRASECTDQAKSAEQLVKWIHANGITVLEASYRLDPADGADWFGRVVTLLLNSRMIESRGGKVRHLFFAGLPETCSLIKRIWGDLVDVFPGGETPRETLLKSGVPLKRVPARVAANSVYDEARLAFGKELVKSAEYLKIRPVDRLGYPEFGTIDDSVLKRLDQARKQGSCPLFRAHMGPYLHDRRESVRRFFEWAKRLGESRFIDILSIGSSQLSQSAFGEDWGDRPDGGGVPLNSESEFRQAWESARPMLVRTYAGTKNIPQLAEMYNRTINQAWHAMSLWWFCKLDGRGAYSLIENLDQQFAALKVIAESGRPFEPNVPHHFAFRGADDVTYIVAAVLAVRVAKKMGIRTMVQQNMLNTPSNTWGVQDLAKGRAMLQLVREVAGDKMRIVYQPRAGLGYFAPDLEKAKIQLAATTALMDDIDPHNELSPEIIHVVSYSEAVQLATPEIIAESVQITMAALSEYRKLRRRGLVDDMSQNAEVNVRTEMLVESARKTLAAIDATIPNVESPMGLYRVFSAGFLPVPDLMGCRDEFPLATAWKSRFYNGGYHLVAKTGDLLTPGDFVSEVMERNKGK